MAQLRRILRLCKTLESDSRLLVTLLGRPTQEFDRKKGTVVRCRSAAAALPFVEEVLWEARGQSSEYAHPLHGCNRFRAAIRKHWRLVNALGMDYVVDGQELLRRLETLFEEAKPIVNDVPDVIIEPQPCIALQRIPPSCDTSVKMGQLLVTHPLACLAQRVLDRAVILLCSTDGLTGGVQGIVVNKPSHISLKELLLSYGEAAKDDMLFVEGMCLHALLDTRLYVGGDVLRQGSVFNNIRWLHTLGSDVPGSIQLLPGVWLGEDVSCLAKLVSSGQATLGRDLRAYLGCAGWASCQLSLELARGVWARADVTNPADAGHHVLQLGPATVSDLTDEDGGRTIDDSLWRQLLLAMGLSALSQFPRGSAATDAMLLDILKAHHKNMQNARFPKSET